MKVVFSVFKWTGFSLSLSALLYEVFVTIPSAILSMMICFTFPFVIFSIIVNSIAILKNKNNMPSIALGVLQCITITGIFAGVCMIVAACLKKKALANN